VIVGAEVVAQNNATGEQHTSITNGSGDYVFPSLAPGVYQISASAPRFSTTRYNGVQLGIGESVTVNGVLKIAGTSSTVTVTDAPPLVQSSDSEIAMTIDASTLESAPLATRNFLQLAELIPGIDMSLVDNRTVGRNSANFSVNGARNGQNNLQINGVDANDISAHDLYSVAVPAPESISEVVIKTSMYDATVSGAGGSVQLVTRSGTNSFHGNVYEYFRNTALNANDPNLKAVGLGPPVLRRNVYGATLGGPLRTDRAFFFLSYQGTNEANGATDQSLYKSVLIADGLTDDRSQAALLRDFQSILPKGTTSIDPSALALLNRKLPDGHFLIPTPQTDGRVTGTAVSTYHEEQFNTNLDVRLGPHDNVAAKFFFSNAPEFWALGGTNIGVAGGSSLPGFGTNRQINNRLLSLQWVHPFRSGAVNEVRAGYNFVGTDEVPQEPFRDSDIGISRATSTSFPGLPMILLARDSGGASIGTTGVTIRGSSPSLSAMDVFSFQRAKHSIRLGGEFRRYRWDFHANVWNYGEIDFPTFAQFLLGSSDYSNIATGVSDRNLRANDYSFFFQDDWKLSQRFTLNLGLRYELDMPVHDTKGRIGTFDPTLYEPRMQVDANGFPVGPPIGGIVVAGNLSPQYNLPGVPKVSDSLLNSIDPNNFAPRIGFAWSPTKSGRFVVRAGYGIFYSRSAFFDVAWDFIAPPFYEFFESFSQTLSNPFPNVLPASLFPTLQPGRPLSADVMDRNIRTPYFQQFNASLEYQFGRDTALQVAYVGSRGMRLFRQVNINQAQIASTNHPLTNAVTGEVITVNTPENAVLRTPFQGVDPAGFSLNQTNAHSIYHSLQATLTRRAARGLQLQAAYTFSKSLDDSQSAGGALSDGTLNTDTNGDVGGLLGNLLDPRANWGVSDFDRTHRLVANCVWDVPKFAWAASSRLGQTLFSNWQISGIATVMSGLPVDIVDAAAGNLYGLFGGRPSWAPGANRRTATSNVPHGYSFNPFAFALPLVQPNEPIPSAHDPTALAPEGGNDFGNLGRNLLRGPAQSNFDLSVAKRFPVSESRAVEVRADVFNALNQANRSNPVSDITVAQSFDPMGRIVSPGDFGRSLSFDSSPRIVQLALKLVF
jgi:hypothetical protein